MFVPVLMALLATSSAQVPGFEWLIVFKKADGTEQTFKTTDKTKIPVLDGLECEFEPDKPKVLALPGTPTVFRIQAATVTCTHTAGNTSLMFASATDACWEVEGPISDLVTERARQLIEPILASTASGSKLVAIARGAKKQFGEFVSVGTKCLNSATH